MINLKFALATACAVVVGWGFAASTDIPASAYVQGELVAQFDGIENAKDADGRIAIRISVEDCFTGTISATNGCCGYAYATPAKPGTVYYKVYRGLRVILR